MTQKSCTQTVQTYTAPLACKHYLQVWGAQGATGNSSYNIGTGGKGGYTYGYTQIVNTADPLYVVVGGVGTSGAEYGTTECYAHSRYAGYNGGGYGQSGGGGATHIAKVSGLLNTLASHSNNGNILLVAGGGGGPDNNGTGGYGGGLTGGTGSAGSGTSGTGGKTNGNSGTGGSGIGNGSFGQGGNIGTTSNDSAGGGGGGWYGGGSSNTDKSASGGGGSSWYGGVNDGGTIAGNAAVPNPNAATGNESGVGHAGNGNARITFLPYE